jgi:hypothetical protein
MGHMHFGTLGASLAKGFRGLTKQAKNWRFATATLYTIKAWTPVEQGHCGLRVKCTSVLGHCHMTLNNCLPRDYARMVRPQHEKAGSVSWK